MFILFDAIIRNRDSVVLVGFQEGGKEGKREREADKSSVIK